MGRGSITDGPAVGGRGLGIGAQAEGGDTESLLEVGGQGEGGLRGFPFPGPGDADLQAETAGGLSGLLRIHWLKPGFERQILRPSVMLFPHPMDPFEGPIFPTTFPSHGSSSSCTTFEITPACCPWVTARKSRRVIFHTPRIFPIRQRSQD